MNSSPRVFSRPFAPQRAPRPARHADVQRARPLALDGGAVTHGSCSTARRTGRPDRTLTRPMSRTRALTACSTSTGETRWKRPGHRHLRDVLVERAQRERGRDTERREHHGADAEASEQRPGDLEARLRVLATILRLAAEDHGVTGARREAGLEHLPHELFERDVECPRRHRHEAVIGHAGDGVHLEQERPARLVHHEIRAGPSLRRPRGEGG
jgi:hypothetical protein